MTKIEFSKYLSRVSPFHKYTPNISLYFLTSRKLVSDSRVKLKYQQHITNSFVDCNTLMRWCPAADCVYAAKVNYKNEKQG